MPIALLVLTGVLFTGCKFKCSSTVVFAGLKLSHITCTTGKIKCSNSAGFSKFKAPFIDIILPSVLDPDMAPPGKHVMSCFVQYAPYDINGGWNDQKKEDFGDTVINTIERYAPNIKDIVLNRQVLTPADLESTFGLSEGNIFHGELTLQQLFSLRPAVKWADYSTPIKNYFQCGSGTHPGGGITGSPGEMAAKKILGLLK